MRKIILAALLGTFALGLGACSYVEQFYAERCIQTGGAWTGSSCEGNF